MNSLKRKLHAYSIGFWIMNTALLINAIAIVQAPESYAGPGMLIVLALNR